MKKSCVILVICVLALLLCGCSESKGEDVTKIVSIAATDAVLENGVVTVVFSDGLRLELGAIEELPWAFTELEDKSLSVTAVGSMASSALSKVWFATAEASLARFGKEIVFVPGTGGIMQSFNGATVEYNYAIGDMVVIQSFEGVGGLIGNLVPSVSGSKVEYVTYDGNMVFRTFEFGAGGNGMNDYYAVVGSLTGDTLLCNGKTYGLVETALVPLLQRELTALTVPSEKDGVAVTALGNDAFANYAALETVTIPACVTALGENLFGGCTSMKKVIYQGTAEQWSAMTLGENWNSGLDIAVEFQT